MTKSFRTADDVSSELGLPALAVVPVMLTASERLQRRRRRVRLVVALVITSLVGGAAIAWMFLQ